VSAACGFYHTAALTGAGRVFTWGGGEGGRLGHGDEARQLSPREVGDLGPAPGQASARVVALAAGEKHTVALLAKGGVFTTGLLGHDGVPRLRFAASAEISGTQLQ